MSDTQKFDCKFYLAINEDGVFIVTKYPENALEELGSCKYGYFARVYEITLVVAGAEAQVFTAELPEPKGEPVEIRVTE